MRKIKKTIVLLLSVALGSLSACGNSEEKKEKNDDTNTVTVENTESEVVQALSPNEFADMVRTGNVSASDTYTISGTITLAYSEDGNYGFAMGSIDDNYGIEFNTGNEYSDIIETIEKYELSPNATIIANFSDSKEFDELDNYLNIIMTNVKIVDMDELEYDETDYDDITVEELVFPATIEAELEDKGKTSYSLSIFEDRFHIQIFTEEMGDTIVWFDDEMLRNAKTLFLLSYTDDDPEEVMANPDKYDVEVSNSTVNRFNVYVMTYEDKTEIAACRCYGEYKYTIISLYHEFEYDKIDDFYNDFTTMLDKIKLI